MSELEKLQQLLAVNNHVQAQDLILSLEDKLEEEKNKYTQKILKEKIETLKKVYYESTLQISFNIEPKKCGITNTNENISINNNISEIKNENMNNNENKINNESKNNNENNNISKNESYNENKNNNKFKNIECIIENKSDCKMELESSQLVFNNCVRTNVIAKGETAFIRNCIECEFELVVGQLRLVGCENIILIVHTKSGVYLEKCKDIVIKKLNDEIDNKYNEVYDFTCPFENTNYKIVD